MFVAYRIILFNREFRPKVDKIHGILTFKREFAMIVLYGTIRRNKTKN